MKRDALYEPMDVLEETTTKYPGLDFGVQISIEQSTEPTCLSSDLQQL